MGKHTTRSGKALNPADAFRKEQRKKEIMKNKKERDRVRAETLAKKNPQQALQQLQKLEEMEKHKGKLDKLKQNKKQVLSGLVQNVKKPEPPPQAGIVKSAPNVELQALYPNPASSIYYHPTLNPYGAPPPGAPDIRIINIPTAIPLPVPAEPPPGILPSTSTTSTAPAVGPVAVPLETVQPTSPVLVPAPALAPVLLGTPIPGPPPGLPPAGRPTVPPGIIPRVMVPIVQIAPPGSRTVPGGIVPRQVAFKPHPTQPPQTALVGPQFPTKSVTAVNVSQPAPDFPTSHAFIPTALRVKRAAAPLTGGPPTKTARITTATVQARSAPTPVTAPARASTDDAFESFMADMKSLGAV